MTNPINKMMMVLAVAVTVLVNGFAVPASAGCPQGAVVVEASCCCGDMCRTSEHRCSGCESAPVENDERTDAVVPAVRAPQHSRAAVIVVSIQPDPVNFAGHKVSAIATAAPPSGMQSPHIVYTILRT